MESRTALKTIINFNSTIAQLQLKKDKMKLHLPTLILAILLFFITLQVKSQSETQEVENTVNQFFEGLNQKNTALMASLVKDTSTLLMNSVIFSKKSNSYEEVTLPFTDFLKGIEKARLKEKKWDEKIWSMDINIDGGLATVSTPYSFFANNELSHCGTNHIMLVKLGKSWKITGLTDTRRRKQCRTQESDDPRAIINKSIDTWHELAAKADKQFFDFMTSNAIYIGTDATERWTKQEFVKFAMPYFDRGKAWSFKAIERNIYLSTDEKTGWFEELLDTWMGECRASGVLEKTDKGWLLSHYQLSIAVPNEKVKAFLELMEEE